MNYLSILIFQCKRELPGTVVHHFCANFIWHGNQFYPKKPMVSLASPDKFAYKNIRFFERTVIMNCYIM